jgi:hypothetical protein
MADAYGMIVFSKSEDCTFNSNELEQVLNQYRWEDCDGLWDYDDTRKIFWYESDTVEYPTTNPTIVTSYLIETDQGETKQVLAKDMKNDDFENVVDEVTEEVSLKQIVQDSSKTLYSGWIELACVANEKSRYVYFDSLRIYANGKATSRLNRSGPMTTSLNFYEEI